MQFVIARKRVLAQAKAWTLEARGTELHGRFEKAYSELLGLLSDKIEKCEDWEWKRLVENTCLEPYLLYPMTFRPYGVLTND